MSDLRGSSPNSRHIPEDEVLLSILALFPCSVLPLRCVLYRDVWLRFRDLSDRDMLSAAVPIPLFLTFFTVCFFIINELLFSLMLIRSVAIGFPSRLIKALPIPFRS